MVFAVQNLHIQYAARILFDSLSFTVEQGERIAFAGQNGAGKSTLMKCIAGVLEPDAGRVLLPNGIRTGYLPQEGIHISGRPLFEEALSAAGDVLEMAESVEKMSARLANLPPDSAEYTALLDQIGALELRLHDDDISKLKPKAESILRGLGFRTEDFGRDCGEFSGGWQMRIALAKLFLRDPDILLLDEPTNHLDIQSQRWMEQYLRTFRGTVVIISHDVALLDSLVTRTIAFHHGRAEEYAGNFSFFLKESATRKEILQRQYKAQQRELAKAHEFIDRFRAKATKASLVQSRIKQLEKIDLIEIEDDDAVMDFHFPAPPPGGHTVVRLENVSKAYGNIELLRDYSFTMEKGDRIAIVGVNGAGKSTFTRLLSAVEPPDSGTHTFGAHTETAFFSQTHADVLNPEQTVLECVTAAASRETAPIVRNILGCFLFRGDDVFKRIGVLSGGERSRVALVCMLLKPANFLIMDEPTNHLDFQSQEVLQKALLEYPGSYCIVSHNRAFLDPIVNKVLEFRPGASPRLFHGNVSTYLESIERENLAASPQHAASPGEKSSGDRREKRRLEAEIRRKKAQILKPLQNEMELLEQSIAEKEARKDSITAALSQPDIVSDNERLKDLTQEFQAIDRELEAAFTRWAELSEETERVQRAIECGEQA